MNSESGVQVSGKKDWLTIVSGGSLILAIIMLIVMTNFPSFFWTGIIIGLAAAAIDFIVEFKGIRRKEWVYSSSRFTLMGVPLQLPVLFFSTGVAIAFFLDIYVQPMFSPEFFTLSAEPVGFVQVLLFIMAAYYLTMYFAGKMKSIIFGILPLALAVYLWFPEPWFLVLALLPMYMDYYLEKKMVKSNDINYDSPNQEMGINIALCYFPLALLLFGIAVLLNDWLIGIL